MIEIKSLVKDRKDKKARTRCLCFNTKKGSYRTIDITSLPDLSQVFIADYVSTVFKCVPSAVIFKCEIPE